jgi:hypothetical protein
MCFYVGSTTYQPGDTLGNTTITLYQRTWTPDLIQDAIDKNGSLKDAFDMDPTVGRDVIFQAALRTHIRLAPFSGSVADPGCLSRIPDPTFFHPGSELSPSRIPDPGSASKNLSILTPKKPKKGFLSSRKYDPGCSSRIPDPDADLLPIPDPGSRGQKGTGSRIRNTVSGSDKFRQIGVQNWSKSSLLFS